jgi:hypothetical protein
LPNLSRIEHEELQKNIKDKRSFCNAVASEERCNSTLIPNSSAGAGAIATVRVGKPKSRHKRLFSPKRLQYHANSRVASVLAGFEKYHSSVQNGLQAKRVHLVDEIGDGVEPTEGKERAKEIWPATDAYNFSAR